MDLPYAGRMLFRASNRIVPEIFYPLPQSQIRISSSSKSFPSTYANISCTSFSTTTRQAQQAAARAPLRESKEEQTTRQTPTPQSRAPRNDPYGTQNFRRGGRLDTRAFPESFADSPFGTSNPMGRRGPPGSSSVSQVRQDLSFGADATRTRAKKSFLNVDKLDRLESLLEQDWTGEGRSLSDSIDLPQTYPRLNSKTGKQVLVQDYSGSGKGDVALALRQLSRVVNTNSIKRDFYQQKFHERNGAKRKRLLSERWRVRFRDGFHHVNKRVNRFVNQGW